MNSMYFIRTEVLRLNQRDFATVAGVSQGTVSRWEGGDFEPSREEMSRIRDEVKKRRLRWNDSWFFQAPERAAS
jgi:DNA-binding transcriptional regulator YiaG